MSDSKCKGCGATIVWGETADGKKIPLDPSAPVYEIDPVHPTKCERTKTAMVSHFKTCPKADQFSGSRRPA